MPEDVLSAKDVGDAIDAVMAEREHSPGERLAVVAILRRANRRTGLAWGNSRKLAERLGIRPASVANALRRGEDGKPAGWAIQKGHLEIARRGQHGAIAYRVIRRPSQQADEGPPSASQAEALESAVLTQTRSPSASQNEGQRFPNRGSALPRGNTYQNQKPVYKPNYSADSLIYEDSDSLLVNAGIRALRVLHQVLRLPVPRKEDKSPIGQQARADWNTLVRIVEFVIVGPDLDACVEQGKALIERAQSVMRAQLTCRPMAAFVNQVKREWPDIFPEREKCGAI